MTLRELDWLVLERPSNWRMGQAYFNYAYDAWPDEVNTLRATKRDCFHDDSKIGSFLEGLEALGVFE